LAGNIRELENMVERWLVLYQGGFLATSHLFLNEGAAACPGIYGQAVHVSTEMERALIMETLHAMNGNGPRRPRYLASAYGHCAISCASIREVQDQGYDE
jgi:DNA-binding NtrC family response regulator